MSERTDDGGTGARVWIGPLPVSHYNGQSTGNPSGVYVRGQPAGTLRYYDFEDVIPDHPALPAVAAELARQGEGAVAIVLTPKQVGPLTYAIDRFLIDDVSGGEGAMLLGDVLDQLAAQGEGARMVTNRRAALERLVEAAEDWQAAFDRECEDELLSDAISDARRQLAAQ